MPASRDQTQKVAFVYSNLYQIYKKGKSAAVLSETSGALGVIAPKIESYKPVEFLSKRVDPTPASGFEPIKTAPAQTPPQPLEGLRKNLESLNELHSRLKFMIQELEDLVK